MNDPNEQNDTGIGAHLESVPFDSLARCPHCGHIGIPVMGDWPNEGIAKLKKWEARSAKARKMLEDVGGAANWKDAKLDWDNDDY